VRKIGVVTGSRAEFGLLRSLLKSIRQEGLELQLYATGAHLSQAHGYTLSEIEKSAFQVHAKVDSKLESDSALDITKSMGHMVIGFAEALSKSKPDILVVLGDRYEILAAAQAALIAQIPIAHLHGGEVTEMAWDDAIRHSLTKMSHLHFVAAECYRKRVIQMGEAPERVFNVGAIGLDEILDSNFMPQADLEKSLAISIQKPFFLVTYHPVTLDEKESEQGLESLLKSLVDIGRGTWLFSYPNADGGGALLRDKIDAFVKAHPKNACAFSNLGRDRYLSAMKFADAVVGNSSSGLLEAPAFKIPTLNIGSRQKGRLRASSVIDCDASQTSVLAALKKAMSSVFRAQLQNTENPFGNGGVGQKIAKVLSKVDLSTLKAKPFYDLP